MKITVLYGQAHKGVSYGMVQMVLEQLAGHTSEVREFFLPADGPGYCHGCCQCFLKDEQACPHADRVQPIAKALEWANVVVLASPSYVLEMSGPLKSLLDHLAYRWVTHRPHGSMFTKVGVVVAASAGAPTGGLEKSLARQLRWLGIPRVYRLGMPCHTAPGQEMPPARRQKARRKAARLAKAVRRRAALPRTSLRGRFMFGLFRKMQNDPRAAWNPADRAWWQNQGWTGKQPPWKTTPPAENNS